MKRIVAILPILLLSSCFVSVGPHEKKYNRYQIYELTTPFGLIEEDSKLIFEDGWVRMEYDFWRQGGDLSFVLYNKADVDLLLEKDKSFVILNEEATPYYKPGITKKSTKTEVTDKTIGLTGTSTSVSVTKTGNEFIEVDEPIFRIPPRSSRVVKLNVLAKDYFPHARLVEKVSRGKMSEAEFLRFESPFVFSNRVAYKLEGTEELQTVRHDFHVSKIYNVHKDDFIKVGQTIDKRGKSIEVKVYYKQSPSRYYLGY